MSNITCVICAKDFASDDELKVTTCGHMFHSKCFDFCINRSETCPKCKQSLTQADIHSVTFGSSKGSEKNPQMSEDKMDAFLKMQSETLKLLSEMELKNRKGRQASDSDDDRKHKRKSNRRRRRRSKSYSDDEDSPRRGSSRAVAERNAEIFNRDGTVIRCEQFSPWQIHVGL